MQSWGGLRLGDENDVITVEVNNVLTEKKINNVFGVIKGFVDAGKIRCLFNNRKIMLSGILCTEQEREANDFFLFLL